MLKRINSTKSIVCNINVTLLQFSEWIVTSYFHFPPPPYPLNSVTLVYFHFPNREEEREGSVDVTGSFGSCSSLLCFQVCSHFRLCENERKKKDRKSTHSSHPSAPPPSSLPEDIEFSTESFLLILPCWDCVCVCVRRAASNTHAYQTVSIASSKKSLGTRTLKAQRSHHPLTPE